MTTATYQGRRVHVMADVIPMQLQDGQYVITPTPEKLVFVRELDSQTFGDFSVLESELSDYRQEE